MEEGVKDDVLIKGLRDRFTFFIENATEKEYYELLEQQLIKQQVEINMLKEVNSALVEELCMLGGSPVGDRLVQKISGKKEDNYG